MSADTNGGWLNHYQRTQRWEERCVARLSNLPKLDFHEALDFSLAYFVWCHSLRDWLIKDQVVTPAQLNDALRKYPEWKICRDLANRSRHLILTQNPTDEDWSISREYDVFAVQLDGQEKHNVNLFFGGRKYQLVEIVRRTSVMWKEVLNANDLL